MTKRMTNGMINGITGVMIDGLKKGLTNKMNDHWKMHTITYGMPDGMLME